MVIGKNQTLVRNDLTCTETTKTYDGIFQTGVVYMKKILLAAVLATGVAGTASAATLDFDSPADGFSWSAASTVSGNCASGQCLAVNPGSETTLTSDSGTFSLSGLWYKLLGSKTQLTLTADTGASVLLSSPKNTGRYVDLGTVFTGITSLTFSVNSGNARVDDIAVADVAPVPLPASGLLLLAGLGMAALRRKKA